MDLKQAAKIPYNSKKQKLCTSNWFLKKLKTEKKYELLNKGNKILCNSSNDN